MSDGKTTSRPDDEQVVAFLEDLRKMCEKHKAIILGEAYLVYGEGGDGLVRFINGLDVNVRRGKCIQKEVTAKQLRAEKPTE
jgi:hypothetical protein